jgi:hypothetical protein
MADHLSIKVSNILNDTWKDSNPMASFITAWNKKMGFSEMMAQSHPP